MSQLIRKAAFMLAATAAATAGLAAASAPAHADTYVCYDENTVFSYSDGPAGDITVTVPFPDGVQDSRCEQDGVRLPTP